MANITQEDYSVLKQPMLKRYIKCYLLDFNFNRVDEISGSLTDLQINIVGDSDIRRNCSATLVVEDSSFDIKPGGKIWLNRYIQPYVGTYDIRTDEIVWNNQGIFLINSPSWTYNATTNTLTFDGVDLASKMTGLRNGQLEGIPHVIMQGENVRSAIIATLAEAGFTKYVVSECLNEDGTIQPVPYDIEISAGGTVWDILAELRDILPRYQIYFDINGVFHYDKIPTGKDLPSVVDDDLFNYILTDEQIDTDFESVKNYVEVWGRTHDVEYYSTETTASGGNLSLTIDGLSSLVTGMMIGWQVTSDINANVALKVNNLPSSSSYYNLVDVNGTQITHLDKDTYYVAVYQTGSPNTWLFLGHLQAQAVWSDMNPDSPFYINGEAGKIRYVCTGGDYDNIQRDDLALERAKMEIYWNCRLQDKIVLTCIPIPWLDVNTLISHAIKGGTEVVQYMVDEISAEYTQTGTMQITAHTYYPYYDMI